MAGMMRAIVLFCFFFPLVFCTPTLVLFTDLSCSQKYATASVDGWNGGRVNMWSTVFTNNTIVFSQSMNAGDANDKLEQIGQGYQIVTVGGIRVSLFPQKNMCIKLPIMTGSVPIGDYATVNIQTSEMHPKPISSFLVVA